MMHVGASLNASISSGAGFGTLFMAVVMLMQTVSPDGFDAFARAAVAATNEASFLFCCSATWRNIGSARQFCRLPK